MVRKCIYCRKRVITNSGRTFHQFPKNEKVRQKWLDALNLPKEPNFKTATVCSDHFQEEDFFFPNNMTLRRKLRSHAVPNVLFCNRGESDGISFEEIKITSDGRILSDDEEEEDTKDFIKTENIFCFDGIQLENGDFQSIKEEPQEEEEDTNLLVDNNIVDSISSDEKNSTERTSRYKRITDRSSVNLLEVVHAVKAVMLEKSKVRTAARRYNIPRNTLRRYLAKISLKFDDISNISDQELQGIIKVLCTYSACAVRQVFSAEEEERLIEYAKECYNHYCGLSRVQVRELAYEFAKKRHIKYPSQWDDNKMCGLDWYYGFMRRHRQFKLQISQQGSSGLSPEI
ncbi:uncharacterized protein LOC122498132 isoform X1 [Leptopilina heterotoma]|uniref:uncharacterized protein LOC122498132 isoform X1 n=1 Tax=Leptopilina heterotoma TaxID=63436 RepID=UPI001CA92D90|nr:uncharacterized protein LOC122498132 isoform X1 [Leptopilina heterotoma]